MYNTSPNQICQNSKEMLKKYEKIQVNTIPLLKSSKSENIYRCKLASCFIFFFFYTSYFILFHVYLFDNKCKKYIQIYNKNSQIKFEFYFLSALICTEILDYIKCLELFHHHFYGQPFIPIILKNI